MSAAEWGHRVFLLECLYEYNVRIMRGYQVQTVSTTLSFIDMYNRPFGIVTKRKKNKVTVVTHGYIQTNFGRGSIVPGKYYYGNSRGQYIEGEWAGQQGVESYFVYTENSEVKMITDVRNRLGLAVGSYSMAVLPKPLK